MAAELLCSLVFTLTHACLVFQHELVDMFIYKLSASIFRSGLAVAATHPVVAGMSGQAGFMCAELQL